jgi:hypothetical protein
MTSDRKHRSLLLDYLSETFGRGDDAEHRADERSARQHN